MPKALPVVDISAPVCCAPLGAGPVEPAVALALALRLKALADPARIQLIAILMGARPDAVCACDLADAVGLSPGTVSHHLARLKKAGLATSERRGVNIFYRADTVAIEALRAVLATCC
ncbi:Rv2640c family ArsR-like transcriptional regulator [Mycolicibacterium fallax]|uniref:ArsR family transcriptional regulator n=1 Tax=Mycolicibacterium fallax TaxID=1793 RepID=A0A1X1RJI7_MYCFA|nr:Rv2640c family ArsR-like transcriptional regulator [Mycolicibacterium fallax]ORV07715.1 ArsR family transcriptional regulator [Mycolicibacterium fallax]BBY99223.1 putative transcriptional regulator, ArsR family protein [Mycolicibacterium fallax]HSA39104.1 Rv2640c family ArsR-like transcriptional regulator [Mycobacterium sp.]